MSTRRKIQLLLWTYFWLLIFEGALRKWLLPGLSTPLLLVRDPVAIAAVMLGWPYLTHRPWAGWFGWLWGIGGAGFFFALAVGHHDPVTALYGARIFWFHWPLVFLFAAVFTRDDVYAFAKTAALIAIPMTILIAFQYSLPQSHFVNLKPGGEEGSSFGGVLGRFRPPGTFSFTNGLADFLGFAAGCVLALLVSGPRPLPKWIWASCAALVVAWPVSISRTVLFKYVLVAISAAVATALSGRNIKNFLVGGIAVGLVALAATQLPIFRDAQKTFAARWDSATEAEGKEEGVQGVLRARVGESTLGAALKAFEAPVLGHGIGLGTNVGAMRAKGRTRFTLGETSWEVSISELGPVLGLLYIGLRVAMTIWLVRLAWRQARRGNPCPFILGGCAVPIVFFGATAQPTSLGFIVVAAGLMLAACNPTAREISLRLARSKMPGQSDAGRGSQAKARELAA